MINLLPLQEKQKVYRMYIVRLVVVICAALFFVLLLGSSFAFPAFFALFKEEAGLQNDIARVQESEFFRQGEVIEGEVHTANTQIGILSKDAGVLPSRIIREVLAQKGSGVLLDGFIITKNGVQKTLSLSLNGAAKDRDTLLTFVGRLKDSEFFTSVELPVSSLVKRTDIPFSLSATLVESAEGARGASVRE